MRAISLVLSALLAAAMAQAGALQLTGANFNSELEGKNALVMFMAPWCGHCKAAKPAFEEVGGLFNGPGSAVAVGMVDCTVENDLCTKHDVSGYPTIKTFDATTGLEKGKDYQGGRDVNSFKTYIEENLKPKCGVNNQDGCTDKEKGFIAKVKDLPKKEIEEQLARLDKMKGSSMAPELKKWLFQRIAILKELSA